MDTRTISIIVGIPIMGIAIFLLYIGLSAATTEKQAGIIDGDIAKITIDNELADLALKHPQIFLNEDNAEKTFEAELQSKGYKVEDIDCDEERQSLKCEFELEKGKKPKKVIDYYKAFYLPIDLGTQEIQFKGEYVYE